jgi:three-Cys-motif partner protein
MEAIAKTKAIDVLVLFPLGIAVNRLLKLNGHIEDVWRNRLNRLFGTTSWYNAFYKKDDNLDLFHNGRQMRKVVDLEKISEFYIDRLKSIFNGVTDKPKRLCNSKGNPLFLLCVAAGNPKGAKTAIKIANNLITG